MSRFNRVVGWSVAWIAGLELLGTVALLLAGRVSWIFALGFGVLMAGFAFLGAAWARFNGGWR